jgi:hypothetical protein
MKNNVVLFLLVSFLMMGSACNNTATTDGKHFGEVITADNAINMATLLQKMGASGSDEMKAKVEGQVEAVCQAKGCWMTIKRPDGETMRVKFKDYGFFVPKDVGGKTVVVEGIAKKETTSVAELQHYAEDEGLPQEEIDKIIEPEVAITFLANGVLIK